MNRGERQTKTWQSGYTIVETMIFLAVSAVMFLAALQFVGGQQNKANFINTVRSFETKLTDIANDVSTGYYQGGTKFTCTAGPTGPSISNTPAPQGTNSDCIFVGTVLKFGEGSDRGKFTQFTAAGLRKNSSGLNVTSLGESKPKIVQLPGSYSTNEIGYGVTVQCVDTGPSCANNLSTNNAAVGFFTKFVGSSLNGGSTVQTDILRYNAPLLTNTALGEVGNIQSYNYSAPPATDLNPTNGITVCLKGAATKQFALVHIGGTGNGLTISTEIKSYSGSTPICA